MAKETVKVKSHSYTVEVDDPANPGKKINAVRVAKRGTTIDTSKLSSYEKERAERLHVFETEEDREAAAQAEETAANLDEFGDDELEAWVKDATAQQVVDAANADPALAPRLLKAENTATDNDPRKTVVAGLEAVQARHATEGDQG